MLFIFEPPDPITDREAMRMGMSAMVDGLEVLGILPPHDWPRYEPNASPIDAFDPFLDENDLP